MQMSLTLCIKNNTRIIFSFKNYDEKKKAQIQTVLGLNIWRFMSGPLVSSYNIKWHNITFPFY